MRKKANLTVTIIVLLALGLLVGFIVGNAIAQNKGKFDRGTSDCVNSHQGQCVKGYFCPDDSVTHRDTDCGKGYVCCSKTKKDTQFTCKQIGAKCVSEQQYESSTQKYILYKDAVCGLGDLCVRELCSSAGGNCIREQNCVIDNGYIRLDEGYCESKSDVCCREVLSCTEVGGTCYTEDEAKDKELKELTSFTCDGEKSCYKRICGYDLSGSKIGDERCSDKKPDGYQESKDAFCEEYDCYRKS